MPVSSQPLVSLLQTTISLSKPPTARTSARRNGIVGLAACLALFVLPGAAAAQQDTLRIAVPDVLPSFAIPYLQTGITSPSAFVMTAYYDGLTIVGEDGDTAARLATAWKNIDETTWQFTIRPNVTFSNGRPLTAEAVAANFNDILLSPYGQASQIAGTVHIAGARVVDPMTVEIETTRPNPIFDKEAGGLLILEPQAWADLGPDGYGQRPIGTGSYKFVSDANWSGADARLVPHEGSWRPGKVANLQLLGVPERQARVSAIVSGQVDVAIGLNMDAYDAIEQAGQVFYTAPAPLVYAIPLISARESSPFKDVRVRQAVNYAYNQAGVNQNLLRGRATLASQPATPNTYGYNPDVKPYPYDPEKAKQLLAEAGYPNGFKTTLEAVMSGSQTADAEIYQQVAIDLARVGVEVEVIPVRFADWVTKWTTARPDGTVDFPDMFGLGYFLTPEVDAVRSFVNHWCDRKPIWYCNEDLAPLVKIARTEFDKEKRKAALQELMRLSHDDAPVLFLINQIDVAGVNKRVKDFKMVNRFINYGEISLAK